MTAKNGSGFTIAMANHKSDMGCKYLAQTNKAVGFGFAAICDMIADTRIGHYVKTPIMIGIVASAFDWARKHMIAQGWIA